MLSRSDLPDSPVRSPGSYDGVLHTKPTTPVRPALVVGAPGPPSPDLAVVPDCNTSMTDAPYASPSYTTLLQSLESRIRRAQGRAGVHVNRELVVLYWQIGREIQQRQEAEGWGAGVIQHLARDLQHRFPGSRGCSARNLKYMKTLAQAFPDESIVQQLAAQLPWGHLMRLLDRVKDPGEREWYMRETLRQGWSRNVLDHQIDGRLHERQGRAITNFEATLPPESSELAQELLKNPYSFDFLTLGGAAREQELERGLLMHLRDFLLELGQGFALVGSQFPLEVDGREFRLDLLFYHLRVRCFVVIDLKVRDFEPEFAGKMSFYLAAVDDLLRRPDDGASIGLILCRNRSRTIVEYALREQRRPIGVSEYRVTHELPEHLRPNLPSAVELAGVADEFLSRRVCGERRGRDAKGGWPAGDSARLPDPRVSVEPDSGR